MELSERQVKQFARLLMPELYEMQAGCDRWMEAIAEMCREADAVCYRKGCSQVIRSGQRTPKR